MSLHKVPPKTIAQAYVRYPELFYRNPDVIAERVGLLLKYIDVTYILRDMSILRHSNTAIVSRMEQVKQAGIESPRPWMIKCLPDKLDIAIKIHSEEKKAKGQHEDVIAFFAEKLNLNLESAKAMLDRCPQLYTSRFRRVRYFVPAVLPFRALLVEVHYIIRNFRCRY